MKNDTVKNGLSEQKRRSGGEEHSEAHIHIGLNSARLVTLEERPPPLLSDNIKRKITSRCNFNQRSQWRKFSFAKVLRSQQLKLLTQTEIQVLRHKYEIIELQTRPLCCKLFFVIFGSLFFVY